MKSVIFVTLISSKSSGDTLALFWRARIYWFIMLIKTSSQTLLQKIKIPPLALPPRLHLSLCPDLPVCLKQGRPPRHSWGNPVQERVGALNRLPNPPNMPLLPVRCSPSSSVSLSLLLQLSVDHPSLSLLSPSFLHSPYSPLLCPFLFL